MRILLFISLSIIVSSAFCGGTLNFDSDKILFSSGESGYHSFRIPSIVSTNNGTLIAVSEGRRYSNKDYGDVDLVFKRSLDSGRGWSELSVVESSGLGTWGNPTLVHDLIKDIVWLFASWNAESTAQAIHKIINPDLNVVDTWAERRVFAFVTSDSGLTWSRPKDLTVTLLPKDYKWDAIGPGAGIQINKGRYVGRLIVPPIGRNIYSDDHGKTWKYTLIPKGSSEGTITEVADGKTFRNDRISGLKCLQIKRRVVTECSADLIKCEPLVYRNDLPDPCSQGSSLRLSFDPSLIVFVNSSDPNSRQKMTMRFSHDNGATWHSVTPLSFSDFAYPASVGGYSSIAAVNNELHLLVGQNDDKSETNSSRSIRYMRIKY